VDLLHGRWDRYRQVVHHEHGTQHWYHMDLEDRDQFAQVEGDPLLVVEFLCNCSQLVLEILWGIHRWHGGCEHHSRH